MSTIPPKAMVSKAKRGIWATSTLLAVADAKAYQVETGVGEDEVVKVSRQDVRVVLVRVEVVSDRQVPRVVEGHHLGTEARSQA